MIEAHKAVLGDSRFGLDRSIVLTPELLANERRAVLAALRAAVKNYHAAVSAAQGAEKSAAA